jgi:hypothetical protein
VPSVDNTIQLIQINEQQGSQTGSQPHLTTCSSALADAPWIFDATPTYGPGASMADHLPASPAFPPSTAMPPPPSSTSASGPQNTPSATS